MSRLVPVLLVLAVFSTALIVGCTDETTVFVEQPIYNEPPTGAGGFLGYSIQDTKKTTCGNCHVGYQEQWVTSGHQNAWKTLQDSGEAQEFCESCHTVGSKGNPVSTGGWAGAKDPRYQDVQCENCHGDGLDHVQNADVNRMFISIAVSSDPSTTCATCHTGTHHPFVEQWEASRHANVNSHTRGNPSCAPCHSAQGALAAWNEGGYRYQEIDGPEEPTVCVVCHNPHGSPNPGNMRFPIDAASRENNMCIKCHHKRAQPDAGGRGPHSPEGPLVLGEEVGWIPTWRDPGTAIRGSHGSEKNTRLCASCHVSTRTVTDSTGFVFQSVGHLFAAIPCVDDSGIPIPDGDCDVAVKDFTSCLDSGCHADETAARSAYVTALGDVNSKAAELEALLDQVDGEHFGDDDSTTVAMGADFNRQLAVKTGSSTHNKFMISWLLQMSIDEVKKTYDVSGPSYRSEE